MNTSRLIVDIAVSAMFEQNCFIVRQEGSQECLVVDPGLDSEKIIELINKHELTVAAILNTHGHADHIAGNEAIKRHWPSAPLIIGRQDADKLTHPDKNLSAAFGFSLQSPPADRTVEEGDMVEAAGITLRVLEIPGHSVGHVVYHRQSQNEEPDQVFVGDVVFAGSIGRTDFPDGDTDTLLEGIRAKLYPLEDETVLYPGHGPQTTVGREKATNPFVRGM